MVPRWLEDRRRAGPGTSPGDSGERRLPGRRRPRRGRRRCCSPRPSRASGPAPSSFPASLAVALLVFGAYLFTLRAGLAPAAADRRSGIGWFESHLDPVFVTDLAGRQLARNPAALGADALAAATPDPDGARYRLTREARPERRRRRGEPRRPPPHRRDPHRPAHAALAHRAHRGAGRSPPRASATPASPGSASTPRAACSRPTPPPRPSPTARPASSTSSPTCRSAPTACTCSPAPARRSAPSSSRRPTPAATSC